MKYHLLKLSRGGSKLEVDPALGAPEPVVRLADIPLRGSDDPLILYILGHAAPDELFEGTQKLQDVDVAEAIENRRGDANTLLIWDVCFAKSFLNLQREKPWTTNYVHIFASQRYERAWHQGGDTNRSIFSTALCNALQMLRHERQLSWEGLTLLLNSHLGGLQTAEISHWGQATAKDFQAQLFDGANTSPML
jgi:hypothetical protein